MTRDGPRWSVSAVALAALPLAFLLAMLLAPTMRLLAEAGSAGTGGFDRSAWLAPVLDPYLRWRLLWSVVQALLTCGLVLVIGVPLAWVLARWEFAGRRWMLRALMLPFVVPTLVAAMGVLALAGPQGLWLGGASGSWWIERQEVQGGKPDGKKKYIFKPAKTEGSVMAGLEPGVGGWRSTKRMRTIDLMLL
jgi:ABC-type Fe3+ transport system permease subunit